jgi:hypothetical protein
MVVGDLREVRPQESGLRLLSTEAQIALAPDKTYRALVADNEPVGVWRMLRRPLIVLVVIATAVPIMAVQRITLVLFAFSIASFGFVVLIQMLVGAGIIASARSRRVSMSRALDLWYSGHVPYSFSLLVVAAVFAATPYASLDGLVALAVFPAVWTARIVAAFCRQVLGTSTAGARWRAASHFVVTWAIAFELVALSAGGWFQITRSVTRFFE